MSLLPRTWSITLDGGGIKNPYADSTSAPFRLRQKRFFAFVMPMIDAIIADKGKCRIIDVGGTEQYWEICRPSLISRNVEIHLVNLREESTSGPQFVSHVADAANLSRFDDMSFDLAHSNSVIEHLESWSRMCSMADNIRRLASKYFIQTPYFWFPFEPHFRTPFFHWLPDQIRYRLVMRRRLGFYERQTTVADAMRTVEDAHLLDRRQLAALFPDARIESERLMGLTKSLMAIRG